MKGQVPKWVRGYYPSREVPTLGASGKTKHISLVGTERRKRKNKIKFINIKINKNKNKNSFGVAVSLVEGK